MSDAKPETPWGLLFGGVALWLVGAALLALGEGVLLGALGLLCAGVGALVSIAGAVGVGVEMGMARWDWRAQR